MHPVSPERFNKQTKKEMGLLSLLRQAKKEEPNTIRISILGLDNSGKTTFLRKMAAVEDTEPPPLPTNGFNIKTIPVDPWVVNFWDVGGSPEPRKHWKEFVKEASMLIWCVDASEPSRFQESAVALQGILAPGALLAKVPVLVLFTKQDCQNALGADYAADQMNLSSVFGDSSGSGSSGENPPTTPPAAATPAAANGNRLWRCQGCRMDNGSQGIEEALEFIAKNSLPPAQARGVKEDEK